MRDEIERYPDVTGSDSTSQNKLVKSKQANVTVIYRGHVYHRQIDRDPPSNQLNCTLMYRGNIYDPRSAQTKAAGSTIVSLIYRGQTYYRAIPQISPDRIYRQPRAINWRWQISSKN